MQHRICIIGGSGFVGRHITAKLVRDGHRVRIATHHRERHRDLLVLPGVEVCEANVHDPDNLRKLFNQQDTVINLVGILNEKRDNGKGFYHAHVLLSEKIVRAARQTGVKRLLHMSALHADAKNGRSHYLRSKGEAEDLVHSVNGLHVTSFRPSVIFGDEDSFVNRFAGLLKISPVLPLACASSRFAPVYVEDVAEAFVSSLDNPACYGQRYDLCGPHSYRLDEIVRLIARVMGIRRIVLPLGRTLSLLQANLLQYAPGKPFSRDNFRSLQTDSVCQGGNTLLNTFNIIPTPLESIIPRYLASQHSRARYDDYRSNHGS